MMIADEIKVSILGGGRIFVQPFYEGYPVTSGGVQMYDTMKSFHEALGRALEHIENEGFNSSNVVNFKQHG